VATVNVSFPGGAAIVSVHDTALAPARAHPCVDGTALTITGAVADAGAAPFTFVSDTTNEVSDGPETVTEKAAWPMFDAAAGVFAGGKAAPPP
jgi:hypothetical protein